MALVSFALFCWGNGVLWNVTVYTVVLLVCVFEEGFGFLTQACAVKVCPATTIVTADEHVAVYFVFVTDGAFRGLFCSTVVGHVWL